MFYGSFCKCAKKNKDKEEKIKETKQVLTLAGISTAKIVVFHKDSTELGMHKNRVFFLFVNILTVLRAGFFGRTTHCHVS